MLDIIFKIVSALKNKKMLSFEYSREGNDKVSTYQCSPILLCSGLTKYKNTHTYLYVFEDNDPLNKNYISLRVDSITKIEELDNNITLGDDIGFRNKSNEFLIEGVDLILYTCCIHDPESNCNCKTTIEEDNNKLFYSNLSNNNSTV